jgi:arsenite methyltransferase
VTTFDAAAAARLRRTYSTPDVVEQRRRIRERFAAAPGERLLDLGCGPGFLAVELAAEVGPEGHVTALDPSEPMLEIARDEVAARGLEGRVVVTAGDALDLPFATGSIDGVVAVQVLEHLDDVAGALAEMRRVLHDGGRLAVVDTDWRTCLWESDDPERTDRVVRAWRSRFVEPDLPGRLPALLESAGFGVVEVAPLPILNTRVEGESYSKGMIGPIAAYVGDEARLGPDIARAWRDDVRGRVAARTDFFSLTRFLYLARPSSTGGSGSAGTPTSKTDSSSATPS